MATIDVPLGSLTLTTTAPRTYPRSSRTSQLFEAVRDLIAASWTFQAWTGSADATAAATHIYRGAVPTADNPPLCWVQELETLNWRRIASGVSMPSGTITLQFVGALEGAVLGAGGELEDWDLLSNRLREWVGGVMDDILELQESSGYLGIQDADLKDTPWIEMRKRRTLKLKKLVDGHYGQGVALRVDWTAAT